MFFKPAHKPTSTCRGSEALARKAFIFLMSVSLLTVCLLNTAQAGECIYDSTFGENGRVITDFFGGFGIANVIALQPDGKIIVGGEGADAERGIAGFALVRYESDGELDYGFGREGRSVLNTGGVPGSEVTAIALQPDGKIVVIGFVSHGILHTFDLIVARFNSNGRLDTSFGRGGKIVFATPNFNSETLVIQKDGKIVLGGSIAQYEPERHSVFLLLRYNTDGSPDDGTSSDSTPGDTFGDNGRVLTRFNDLSAGVAALALQRDGKIVAAGTAYGHDGSDFALARYKRDGQLDTTFDGDGMLTTSFKTFDEVEDVLIQTDGKIVVAGMQSIRRFGQTYQQDFTLARYNTDGQLDTSFDNDGRVSTITSGQPGVAFLHGIALQRDGKIVAAGISYAYIAVLTRYNRDGSLDTTFATNGKFLAPRFTGTTGTEAKDVAVQPDGRIVFAGTTWEQFNFGVVRLLGDVTNRIESLRLSDSTPSVCQIVEGTVRLCVPAPPGGLTVTLKSTNPAATVPSSITIPEGQDEGNFSVGLVSADAVKSGEIIAKAGQFTEKTPLTVLPISVSSLTLSPNPVQGSHGVTGTVTLKCHAPAGGVTLTLTSSNPTVAYPTLREITVSPGSSRTTFTIRTNDVPASRTAIIKATANGFGKSQTLTIQ